MPRFVLRPPRHVCPAKTPTRGKTKDEAARAFLKWIESRTQADVVVFSDGSKLEGRTGWGYAVWHDNRFVLRDAGRLHRLAEVYDAEVVGAWEGLRKTLSRPQFRPKKIWVCLDNTSAIQSLVGEAGRSSQAAAVTAVDKALS